MRFHRLRKIFDPRDHQLPTKLGEYAQSPQSIDMDGFIRIFFSTRERDGVGMFTSHPAYVDMDRDFQKILRVSSRPLLSSGDLGCFDEHGVFPISPVHVGDSLYAYTTGWTRRRSVPTDSGIGLAISEDGGESFSRFGQGPILGASLQEPFLVSDGFVLIHDGVFHMWYIYGQRWLRTTAGTAPERVYKIAHASSSDGKVWKRSGLGVLENWLGEDECQALPTVVNFRGQFHMAFCYRYATDFRNSAERAYRLGYAISDDLVTWKRSELELIGQSEPSGWDGQMQCYPNLFLLGDQLYLLYNGNEFGRYGFGVARLS